MTEILVIRLSNYAAAEWLIVDSTGARVNNVAIGSLEQAAGEAVGRKVVVLVPGTDVLLSEPELPPKNAAKLAQMVPYALEEQLASDVETLHFAIGKRDGRPGTPVAVVAREKMDAWLAALTEVGLVPSAMYADTQAVPITPNGVTLLLDGNAVYVQRPQVPGTVLEIEPLLEALQLALEGGTESREHATFYLTEEHYERERDLLEGMREFTASLQLKLLPDGALPVMAATIAQQPGLNLLQGAYAVKSNLQVSLAPWRYAAILAGVFVVVHLGFKITEFRKLSAAETRLNSEIEQIFKQTIPGVPMNGTNAARRQFEQRLAQLGSPVSGGDQGLLLGLGTLGQALAQTPDSHVEALSYRNQTLELKLVVPTTAALDQIRNFAGQRGMSATIGGVTPRNSKVEGRLQLKTSGA